MKRALFTLLLTTAFFAMHSPALALERFFPVQSVDTMKYSRDTAREKLSDKSFDQQIDTQIKNIAALGATHVAIATPYDEEFYPFLKRWVDSARFYKLNVWFRGNFSGWEGWFDYPKISRQTHTDMTIKFIQKHPELFADGDIFTSCPECENGGSGDPRQNGDVAGYRNFLTTEYNSVQQTFSRLGKNITANYYSMNGDVARLVMDQKTTKKLGGIVTIDHYVATGDKLDKDITDIAKQSGGKIVLGEFGTPIPDIHGTMSEKEQANWIDSVFKKAVKNPNLVAINYWVNMGGSTKLWNDDYTTRTAVSTIKKYYSPALVKGVITDSAGKPIFEARVHYGAIETITDVNGGYAIPMVEKQDVTFEKTGYTKVVAKIDPTDKSQNNIVLEKAENTAWSELTTIITYITTRLRMLFGTMKKL